jgi:hypothetical protein
MDHHSWVASVHLEFSERKFAMKLGRWLGSHPGTLAAKSCCGAVAPRIISLPLPTSAIVRAKAREPSRDAFETPEKRHG